MCGVLLLSLAISECNDVMRFALCFMHRFALRMPTRYALGFIGVSRGRVQRGWTGGSRPGQATLNVLGAGDVGLWLGCVSPCNALASPTLAVGPLVRRCAPSSSPHGPTLQQEP